MSRSKSRIPKKENESDLRAEYERMSYVMRALGGGIWDLDVITGGLNCSRRWHEILGLDYETQRVLTVDQFKPFIHPEDVDRATRVNLAELRRAIARDERYSIEFRIIRRDGATRWIRSVATLIGDAERKLRAVGCITDITPMVESESISKPENFFPAETLKDTPPAQSPARSRQDNAIALSAHEKECLRWVSFGKTAKETASILGKSPRTIEFHLNKAVEKLGAANKVQAAFLAIQQKLI